MDPHEDTAQDNSAKSDVKCQGRGSDKITGDALSIITDMQTTLAKQNDRIFSQIKGISSDIGNMKRDISKVTKIVSKLETARDRDTYAANVLQCEFRTFSWKVVSTLRSLQGNEDASDCADGFWNEYFHGEENVLSNFYMSPLRLNGLEFKSAEHMYQYKKAEFHGMERDIGEDILHAPYGAAAKGAANRNIEVCAEWEEKKEDIMFEILCLKAKQCDPFAEKLHSTGSRPLIHDLPVYLWGWGTNGMGLNLMGKILEKVRNWMQTSNPLDIATKTLSQLKTQTEDSKIEKTVSHEPASREDCDKNAPVSQKGKQKSDKRRNRPSDPQAGDVYKGRNRPSGPQAGDVTKGRHRPSEPQGDVTKGNSDTTAFSDENAEDWPSLPQPGAKESKRHVTSDDKSKSLQVEVVGDSQGQRQDHDGTDTWQRPHQRRGRGRGLLMDRHRKGYGGRGGGYNQRDGGRFGDKGDNCSEEQDQSTDSSTHEQLNSTEKHDDPPTHREKHGHRGGRGNGRENSRWKPRENERRTRSETPEEDRHAGPTTDRDEYTGGKGSERRGNSFQYEQPGKDDSRDSTRKEQTSGPDHHGDLSTHDDERPVESSRGRTNTRRGSYHHRGSRHDSYSGESRGSKRHEYYSGEPQGRYYSGRRSKAPYHDYANRMYSDRENATHEDDPDRRRHEQQEDSSHLQSGSESHPLDLGVGVPPGLAVKGQNSAGRGRAITNVKDAGGDRHVKLEQDQCQVTLDCHPTN